MTRDSTSWAKILLSFLLTAGMIVFIAWLSVRESGWRAAYYPTAKLTGIPVYRNDPAVDFDWGPHAPLPLYVGNQFSARWDSCLMVPQSQSISFHLGSDDGSRLYVDGELVIDNWRAQALAWEAAVVDLGPGAHELRVEYFDAGGLAEVFLEVTFDESGAKVPPEWFVVPERRWGSFARIHRSVESPQRNPPRFCDGMNVPEGLPPGDLAVAVPKDASESPEPVVLSDTAVGSCESSSDCAPPPVGRCDLGVIYRVDDQLEVVLDEGRNGTVDAGFDYAPVDAELLIGRWRGPEDTFAVVREIRGARKFFFDDDGDDQFERSFEFGKIADRVIVGDFDGDGLDEVGLVTVAGENYKWLLDHGDGRKPESDFVFGRSGDLPVVGSWDGGPDDHAGVVREDEGKLRWFLDTNHDSDWELAFSFGEAGDQPVVGDWNADGVTDAGVIRKNEGELKWLFNYNTPEERDIEPEQFFVFGATGDTPLICDWDGDGDDDAGVVREIDGRWWFLLDLDDAGRVPEARVPSARANHATPIVGDWDGR